MEAAGVSSVVLQADLRALSERNLGRLARGAVMTRRAVYAGAAVYALLFAGCSVIHFEAFQAHFGDLGWTAQAIWSTVHGHFLESTTPAGQNVTRLGAHVDPFLVLFAPLWLLWSSPMLLSVVQAVAVASGALPVYWLARKHLASERAGAHFAFAYLLYPATQFSAFTIESGFHAVSMAVPLLLYAIWFLDEDRLVAFAVFALLAVSTKEEIGAAVGCLGIWYAVRKGRRATGATILVLGFAATLVDFLVIIPYFSPTGVNPFAGRYTQVGGTPAGILHKAVTDPMVFVHAVATWHKLLYVVLVFVPFLGLWLFEPLLLLCAIPDLVINLLSSHGDQTTVTYHWTAGIIPFVVAASILGLARLRRDRDQTSLYALVGAAVLAVVSPITVGVLQGDLGQLLPSNSVHAARAGAVAKVPASVPVSASNELGAYVASRRYVFTFPVVRDARWVLVDRNDSSYENETGYRRALRRIESAPGWRRVYASHGVLVLHKIAGA
jgi:uncharacterized membrane protein